MRWGLQIFFIHYILFRSSIQIFLTQVTNSSLCTLQFDTSLATLSQAGIRQTGPPRSSWLPGWGCFVKVTWMPSLWRMCCPNWARFLKRCPSLHTSKAWVRDKRFWAALQFLCSWVFCCCCCFLCVLFVFLSFFFHSINEICPQDLSFPLRILNALPVGVWMCVRLCAIVVYVKWWERCKWSVVVGFLCGYLDFSVLLVLYIYILPTLLFLFCALRAHVRCK